MATTAPASASTGMSPTVAADPILRAAYALLCEVGTRRLSVASVAQRADLSRMTVYRRHGDLDRILRTVMTAEIAHVLAPVEAAMARITPIREALAVGSARVVTALIAHPVMRSVVRSEPETLLPYLTARLGTSQVAVLAVLAERIAAGIDEGSVGPCDPGDRALGILIACQSFVMAAQIVEAHDLDPERQVHDLVFGLLG